MVNLVIDEVAATFRSGDHIAGRYRFTDEYKPYLHPLNTPAGHTISLASPHDHKHHKGLMFALSVPGVNFWEERPTLPDEVPGRQVHERFRSIQESGEIVGFEEDLTWTPCDDDRTIFHEVRSITCKADFASSGYAWTWKTELSVVEDTELTMSKWSARQPDGRLVNYHGLGIRFRREFGCTGGNRLIVDGEASPITEGSGLTPGVAEFHGSIDETWPIQQAGIRIRQDAHNGLFVMDKPFAFMGLGPSNLGIVPLKAGDLLRLQYDMLVFDIEPR